MGVRSSFPAHFRSALERVAGDALLFVNWLAELTDPTPHCTAGSLGLLDL